MKLKPDMNAYQRVPRLQAEIKSLRATINKAQKVVKAARAHSNNGDHRRWRRVQIGLGKDGICGCDICNALVVYDAGE